MDCCVSNCRCVVVRTLYCTFCSCCCCKN
jgi:hypothetical protein